MVPIHIKEINVQNLGPVSKFQMKPGQVNLVYGRNEMGKTHLVEFLICSLFKQSRQWTLRSHSGTGRVLVGGLEESDVAFSSASPEKLDDYLDPSTGIPTDISRLLIVKGAELAMSDAHGGVDRAILRHYLSSLEILDHIDDRISKTIQETRVTEQRIEGSKRGEIKVREELQDSLKKIDQLFNQINRGYSGGGRRILADKIEKVQEKAIRMDQARRHLAYQQDLELKTLEQELEALPGHIIQSLRENLLLYKQKIDDYKRKKALQREAEEKSRDHEWLSSASDVYVDLMNREAPRPRPVFLVLTFLSLVSAGTLTFLGKPVAAAGALAGVLFFGLLVFRHLRKQVSRSWENDELENLKTEYTRRFDEELTGLAALRERLSQMNEDYSRSRILKDQLFSDLRGVESLKLKLEGEISRLCGAPRPPSEWESVIFDLTRQRQDLEARIREKQLSLARLGVDESDYSAIPSEVEYSRVEYDELNRSLTELTSELERENQKLDILKQMICQVTGDEISTDWEPLIQNLRLKRNQAALAYQKKTAEILGKLMVHRVLETLQQDEDAKIIDGLTSELIQKPLIETTGRYNRLYLSDDRIFVSDEFHDFPLADLSTGAQEQVLLALRIGFSQKIIKKEPLFLILDDAFQYSDWERRRLLVDAVLGLARSGWQIFYFTMDDHIRDLFNSRAHKVKESYQYVELMA